MQLARTAATLKGQFLPVLFCRGERGGERERIMATTNGSSCYSMDSKMLDCNLIFTNSKS